MNWAIALPILSVVVAPLFGWLTARRQANGRIDNTNADTLWDENSKLREAYKADRVEDKAEIAALRADNTALRVENTALRKEARHE